MHASLTALAVLASLVTVPHATPLWSGSYLRVTDHHQVLYDQTTQALFDLGLDPLDSHCAPSENPMLERCGDCFYYVPPGETSWKDEITPFLRGRCANLDATDIANVQFRSDVRTYAEDLTRPALHDRWFEAGVQYRRSQEPTIERPVLGLAACDELFVQEVGTFQSCTTGVGTIRGALEGVPDKTFAVCPYNRIMLRNPSFEGVEWNAMVCVPWNG